MAFTLQPRISSPRHFERLTMLLFNRTALATVFAFCAAATVPAYASDAPGSVTIHRDQWGVPYIFAATDADAAYGLGYAMAEDRLADLYTNVRTATGRMAEAFGPEHVEMDYVIRMARIPERCEEYWTTAPQHIQDHTAAFLRGVQAYVKENPDKDPEHALELEPWHVGAIGQAMISRWPLGQIQDELRNTQNSTGFGSNQWSVARKRSADGRAILLTDPHLTWEGMAVFYEAHVFGDHLEMHGYFLVGSPLLAFGHNGYVGWAPTTGGPDTADIYELELNPENQGQYKYDGEWRRTRVSLIRIPVKGEKAVTRPAAYSHLGPFVSEPKDGKAYVGASPYLNEVGIPAQFWDMVAARDADAFYEALGQNHYMEQNIMYADRAGTIGYVRAGRVPIRPEGYNWLEAVPGNTSATAWTGIHPIEDLVQIKNPGAGFMQNCNISPGVMMPDSPLHPDKYPSYIYNVSWDSQNTRGLRALELLGADNSLTVDEAKAVAFDVHDVLADSWNNALETALENYGDEYKDEAFQQAAQTLLDWVQNFTADSRAEALVF
ncbi:MAG: penicillin acylase family protein, partial [Candidatus Hydrogenedentales bacterium]